MSAGLSAIAWAIVVAPAELLGVGVMAASATPGSNRIKGKVTAIGAQSLRPDRERIRIRLSPEFDNQQTLDNPNSPNQFVGVACASLAHQLVRGQVGKKA